MSNPFPTWRPSVRRLASRRGGFSSDAALDLIEHVLAQINVSAQRTRRGIRDPFVPSASYASPRTLQELNALLESFEANYEVIQEARALDDAQADQQEQQDMQVQFDAPVEASVGEAGVDADGGDVDGALDAVTYCLRGFFIPAFTLAPAIDQIDTYEDITVEITNPNHIAILSDPGTSRASLDAKVAVFMFYYRNLQGALGIDDVYDGDEGRAFVNAAIVGEPGEPCAGDDEPPALDEDLAEALAGIDQDVQQQEAQEDEDIVAGLFADDGTGDDLDDIFGGSGRRRRRTRPSRPASSSSSRAGASVPTRLNPLHERRRYRDPLLRRSYNDLAPCVDFPGVEYDLEAIQRDPLAGRYKDPWLRHNVIADCCWMNSIIDLVNVHTKRVSLTYEKLWRLMGMRGAFDPVRARQGFCVQDMVPLFDKLDRSVRIYDGERRVIYERRRSTRAYEHLLPNAWVFLVTEHHVYSIYHRSAHRKFSFFLDASSDTYDRAEVEHPYQRISPLFPAWERSEPALLRANSKVPTIVLLLGPDEGPQPGSDYASLRDIMCASRFDGKSLHVVVQSHLTNTVLLRLVREYKYRPTVRGVPDRGIHMILVQSLTNRIQVLFTNPLGLSMDRRGHLPPAAPDEDEYFTSARAYKDFVSEGHDFFRNLCNPALLSTMHESTHNIARSTVRGGIFGWTIPESERRALEDETVCSLDVNRIYPATLQTSTTLPTCSVFDRFERVSLPPTCTPESYLDGLQLQDLLLVFVYDTPTPYLDRGCALCFMHNLRDFVRRPNVVLVGEHYQQTLHAAPTGVTYVRLVAVLRTQSRRSKAWEAVSQAWLSSRVKSRSLRKRMLVRGLGRMGISHNRSSTVDAHVFCNPEEATLYADKRCGKVQSIQDEVYLAFGKTESMPRLQGYYLLHLYVLDTYRAILQHWYDQLTLRGVQVLYVRCDEFFFRQSDLPKVLDYVCADHETDSLFTFGQLKAGHRDVQLGDLHFAAGMPGVLDQFLVPDQRAHMLAEHDTVCAEQLATATCEVDPRPDEFHIDNLADHSRLLLRASVPGAGKSHAVLSAHAANAIVVCPTNALCVEFTNKYPGCKAMTLHRFLQFQRIGSEDEGTGDTHGKKEDQASPSWIMSGPEAGHVLLLDEVYMYSLAMLNVLYFRLAVTGAARVYATGDPNQLPPIDEETTDELFVPTADKVRRMRAIDMLFPQQMNLKVCKRGSSREDNRRMETIARLMRSPGFTVKHILGLVREQFTRLNFRAAMRMLRSDPYGFVAVCYYNRTCHRIAKEVLPGGTKLAPGTRLVNRLRRGEHLMVNYEYVVDRVLDDQVILKDETYGSVVTVPKGHVERHMHWSQTRTCHSLQGSSVSAKLVLFNLSSKRISPEFIYVALTRARDLKEVYFVEEEEDREVLPGALSFLMSLE